VTSSRHPREPEPWDEGLQNERTALAWRRSTLALLGTALIVARLLAETNWPLGAALAAGSVACSVWIFRLTARRYRHAAASLVTDSDLPDGRLPAATLALVVLLGAVALLLTVAAA
jgi:uncharacterized membrane protein YidH (DUF202 family)